MQLQRVCKSAAVSLAVAFAAVAEAGAQPPSAPASAPAAEAPAAPRAAPRRDARQELEARRQFRTFLLALEAADLAHELKGESVTVLAPTDRAFARLPRDQMATLMLPENVDRLRALLRAHLIAGPPTAEQLARRAPRARAVEVSNGFVVPIGHVLKPLEPEPAAKER